MLNTIKKILFLLPASDHLKLGILISMMFFSALLEVVGIGMIPVFVSILESPDRLLETEWLSPVWDILGISDGGDLLIWGSIALIGVFVFKNAYMVFYKYTQNRFLWNRFTMIGSNLFKRYMSAPYQFHLGQNTSKLLRNVTQEAQYLSNNVMKSILRLLMDGVLIFSIFLLLLWVEPLITVAVAFLLGGGGGLFLKFLKNKTRSYGSTAQEDRELMIRSVNEGIGGVKEAKVLNREGWFYERFKHHISRYSDSQVFRQTAGQSTKPVIETISVTGMLLIALILYIQGSGLSTVIPILTLFGAATIRLMPAIQESAKALTDLRYYSYTVNPLFNDTKEIGASDLESKKLADLQPLELEKEITFKNLGYSYPGSEENAVDHLNLSIPKGHAVGFVGASGAGKTTVGDLLLGLLTPNEGSINVDSRNIQNNLSAWQRNIGYIPQFIFLADNTIRNNIAFGLPDENINDAKLRDALEAAQLTDLIETLPSGVETVIGEKGTRLSGGQRQRIGIARALYHNPQVLLMDEATSALDNETEKNVISAIEKLKGKKTIIMIAHRLSTVENCDTLYFMKDGQIIDSGSYDQLIDLNKDFRKMALSN